MPERKLIYADTVVEKLSELVLLDDHEKKVLESFVETCLAVDAETKWIPVSERLPEEHDSIFKRWHGTNMWQRGMFCTISDTVLVSIENNDGTRNVKAMHTNDGKWNLDNMPWAKKVTHWMPLPEPPQEE